MPRRRLEQLLSSSLRYHLSMVFAEEEGGSSTLLTSIQARVRESAAANGFEVNLALTLNPHPHPHPHPHPNPHPNPNQVRDTYDGGWVEGKREGQGVQVC